MLYNREKAKLKKAKEKARLKKELLARQNSPNGEYAMENDHLSKQSDGALCLCEDYYTNPADMIKAGEMPQRRTPSDDIYLNPVSDSLLSIEVQNIPRSR